MAKTNTPFPYYGAKANLAPWIVSHLPAHRAYIEPFAGSAAVLMAKAPSHYEVINDLDGEVVNFWRVLRDQHDDLVGALQLTPYARDEYLECRDGDAGSDPVERARRFFVRASASFNASTAARTGFSASHPRKYAKPATFSRRVDGRLAAVAARIRGVEIENIDALALIQRWDTPDAVLYLDPPYLNSTRVSHSDYATDNGDDEFHVRLISAVSETTSRVVLSGYASDVYDDLLTRAKGWSRIDRDVYAPTSSSTTASRRTESLWVNFDTKEGSPS